MFGFAVTAALAKREKTGPVGYLWEVINRVVSLPHTSDWPVCTSCGEKGKIEVKVCSECGGDGFVIPGS
jgi:hypothetical protein